uniref:Uncharacterized protein n=1 Tax=Corethron hystrix TaxID=216773 RepID=A0A7S1BTN3_9STRA
MANAAFKKSQKAKAEAVATYRTPLLAINAIYVLYLFLRRRNTFTTTDVSATVIIWILTVYSYVGIVDDYGLSASLPAMHNSGKVEKLRGGRSLDLLGLAVTIQVGSIVLGRKAYWMFLVFPAWGVWIVFGYLRGFFGSWFGSESSVGAEMSPEEEAVAARAQKRSERRRIKRY